MPQINFPVVWVNENSVIPKFDTPEAVEGKRFRSFLRVYGRQDENNGHKHIPGGLARLHVGHPDATRENYKSTMVEVFPNRAYMVDVEKIDFGNIKIIVQDLGSNGVSSFGIDYPYDVYDAIGHERIKEMQGY